ncbi:uncharacterized protein SOCE26_040050 [Sorangium cellulosum]|uniref:Uncharacterized protein n=2 Tax=Sorangium cellulosum TaxID=56 RepID=A0A2L0ETH2_SORCE|nr:uncharacterized protein SOCE26_040050 [Sorangium cellulosum]
MKEQMSLLDVEGGGKRRRKGKGKPRRGRAIEVQAEVNELPARPLRLPPGRPAPLLLPAGTPGAPGRGLVLAGSRPLAGWPVVPRRTTTERATTTTVRPRRTPERSTPRKRSTARKANTPRAVEVTPTARAAKVRTRTARAAPEAPKPARKRAPRKARATAPKRGPRVVRGVTYVCRPAKAESALEREVRDVKRLLTTRKPQKAPKKRAPSRRKR